LVLWSGKKVVGETGNVRSVVGSVVGIARVKII
jgi:hypothetical protein